MCNDVNTNLQLNKDPVFVLSTPASCSAFRQERHTWDPALLLGRSGIEELNFRWKQTVSMNSVGAILGLLSQNHSVRPELAQSPSLHLPHEIKHNLLLPAGKPIREPLLLRLQTAPWGKAQQKSHNQHRRCHGPWGYHAEQQPGHPSSERDRRGPMSKCVLPMTDTRVLTPACHSSYKPPWERWPRHGGIYDMFITQHLNTWKRKALCSTTSPPSWAVLLIAFYSHLL